MVNVQELSSTRFFWILATIPVCRNETSFSVLDRGLRFSFLAQSTASLLEFHKKQVSPVIAFQHVHLTRLRDGDPSRTSLSVLVYPYLRLKVEDVMGGALEELEEDLGWFKFPALKVSWMLKKAGLRDELAGKPRTTIGTKFSLLQGFRIPFWMRCGFWPLIHS